MWIWIIYGKTYTEEDIGRKMEKKMGLGEVWRVNSWVNYNHNQEIKKEAT
jgi:hypothetical protein